MTDAVALGRRAVACPRFRWLPGMLTLPRMPEVRRAHPRPFRVVALHDGGTTLYDDEAGIDDQLNESVGPEDVPDVRDPATLGCLLHLVREARSDPYLSPYFDDEITSQGCWCIDDGDDGLWMGDTEAEALVAALEAAYREGVRSWLG